MRTSLVLLALVCLSACEKGGGAPDAGAPVASTPSSAAAPSAVPPPSPSAALIAPPDTVIAQHVLVAYKGAKRAPKGVTRTKSEARARAEEALKKIHSGTPFEDVVKDYSDDAGSADRMGNVGKFRREGMDPAFSAAAFRLTANEVSEPVETPFGFHIIKRTQ